MVMEINYIKWEERNMMELVSPEKGGKPIYIFKPLLNKIEQIFIDWDEDFPIHSALYNRFPYCFCSGGKIKIDNEYIELCEFYTLKRTGLKNFEKILLLNMLEEKKIIVYLKYLILKAYML